MLLKNGSKGEDVKKLQSKLGLVSDGIFGSGTEKVVKEWQVKNGLVADGIVGDSTWSKLFNEDKVEVKAVELNNGVLLNLAKLKGHIPDVVLNQIPDTASKFQINTPLRLAHFLAQCGHESGGFRVVQENLNYSKDGLKKIFPKYFPGNLNEIYAKQPEKIASRVYGGRMGNGDEASRDGYKFRGRGYIQLTGKENYTLFGKSINEDIINNPDLVSSKYPLLSAAWFFTKNGLHKIADEGATDVVVTKITKRVNGGTIGLSDRISHFKEYYNLLK